MNATRYVGISTHSFQLQRAVVYRETYPSAMMCLCMLHCAASAMGHKIYQILHFPSDEPRQVSTYPHSPDVTVLDQHTGVVNRLGQTLLENLKGRNKRGDGSERRASIHCACWLQNSQVVLQSPPISNRSNSNDVELSKIKTGHITTAGFAICKSLLSQMHKRNLHLPHTNTPAIDQ